MILEAIKMSENENENKHQRDKSLSYGGIRSLFANNSDDDGDNKEDK